MARRYLPFLAACALACVALPPTRALCVTAAALRATATQGCCFCPRVFDTGYSRVVTPGCERGDCAPLDSSVSDDLVGVFWGLEDGHPAPGIGIDNGTFPALGGWLQIYPGYGAFVSSTWDGAGVDGCIHFSAHREQCMAMLLMDVTRGERVGAFAVLTRDGRPVFHFDFSQPGDIVLVSLPEPRVAHSLAHPASATVDVELTGLASADIAAGVMLDPACSPPHPIRGYRVFVQELPAGEPPPADRAAEAWTPLGAVVPLDTPTTVTLSCNSGVSHYLAYGLEFDGGFTSAYLSGNSTRIECDANLAEPARPGRELRGNRERPGRKR